MKGIEVKKILQENGVSISHCARILGTSQQNLSSALNSDDIRSGLLEDIASILGKDVPFFYGVDSSACSAVAGENATAVAGNNNRVNSESLVNLLTKKDEQIDRLLNIIESLSK